MNNLAFQEQSNFLASGEPKFKIKTRYFAFKIIAVASCQLFSNFGRVIFQL